MADTKLMTDMKVKPLKPQTLLAIAAMLTFIGAQHLVFLVESAL
ncbi:hypothetical protein [Hahella ganghwensis]|nr:hypothetical protein [Hahella ganghwensis]